MSGSGRGFERDRIRRLYDAQVLLQVPLFRLLYPTPGSGRKWLVSQKMQTGAAKTRRKAAQINMSGLTEIHSHFLYGLDDGAKTRAEMTALIDNAHAEGVRYLFATPHVVPGVKPFNRELFGARLNEARQYCQYKRYPMTIKAGAEILFTPAIDRFVMERRLPTLGNSNTVLVEFTPDITYSEIQSAIDSFMRADYELIIAHVERYPCLYYGRAYRIKEKFDVQFQMNCGTILHKRGIFSELRIRKWLRDGLIDYVASDAHDPVRRRFRSRSAYKALTKMLSKEEAREMIGWGPAFSKLLE